MLARWIEKLGQINFEIDHQAWKKITHADCLSRVPAVEYPSLGEEKTQILNEQPTKNSWSDVFGDQTDDLRQHQQKSREIKEVFCWVEQKKRPEKKKNCWGFKNNMEALDDFQKLYVSKGMLRRQRLLEEHYRVQQIVVHRSYMDVILPLLHYSLGHQGV